jgi:hypothetical protein
MFEILEFRPYFPMKQDKGRLIEDVPMIDSFPLRGSVYKVRQWITEDIMEWKKMFDYDFPVNTWYVRKDGEVLDMSLRPFGKIMYREIGE